MINYSELDAQRSKLLLKLFCTLTNKILAEEANRTFSTVLQSELFGDEVPQPNSLPTSTLPSTTNSLTAPFTDAPPRTPPRSQSTSISVPSTPITPSRNLLTYRSPASKRSSTASGSTPSSRHSAASSLGSENNPSSDIYSLSPIRFDSQAMLLSPRKQPRAVPKMPFKVLDAPELLDDFYVNLVDWSSTNILGVGLGNSVYLWFANTGRVQKLCDLPHHGEGVTSVSWIGHGTHLAVGTGSGSVMIWDAERLKRVRTMSGHDKRVGALSWNEHILTSGSRDRTILHRDVRVPEHWFKRLSTHKQEVCGLKWNVEDGQLASGGNDNRLIVWDKLEEVPLHRFSSHTAAVKAIAWSPHQRGLLVSGGGTADGRIRFWNTITGEALQSIDTGSQVCNLAWSKTSNELVSTHGYQQNQVVVWKYPSMTQVAALTGHTFRVLYLAMSPDGQTVVTGAGDETLRFWNLFGRTKQDWKSSPLFMDLQQIR